MSLRYSLKAITFVAAIACTAGCASQPKTFPLPFEAPDLFSAGGSAEMPQRWWTVFGDDHLNAIVDSSFASNFELKTAWQRLRAARAVADRESSGLFPDLELFGSGELHDGSEGTDVADDFEVGLAAEYEVDLWGRIRSEADAEKYRALASLADYQAAAVTLSAEIVRTWYQLAESRRELSVIDAQIETNETVLDLLKNRLGTGQIQSVDIIRQRQLVAATREQRSDAESRAAVLQHRLAVLLGRAPREPLAVEPDSLPDLPDLPDTGIPMDLVRRRPDVHAALDRLRAADRDLAAAVSSQYPRLTLSASVSSPADRAENLFEQWVSSLAGGVLVPIFYGGALRAEVDRNEAVRAQRLYEYGQSVLTALREVEDALVLEATQTDRIRSIATQIDLAGQAYEQLRVQYLNGAANYLDVLTALDEIQSLDRRLLAAELARLEYRISLYRALAGSFAPARQGDGTTP